MTPMAWLSNLFANWRGDVIFTFKIIASQYHKGVCVSHLILLVMHLKIF